ncbi:hypothetical protein GGQ05_000802 [Salinibacter ruber]|nr:hypothetical protein [Salinibacter ruber]
MHTFERKKDIRKTNPLGFDSRAGSSVPSLD